MFSPCLWKSVEDTLSPRRGIIGPTYDWEKITSDSVWRREIAEELQYRFRTLGDNRKQYTRMCRRPRDYDLWGRHLYSRFSSVRFGCYKIKASETKEEFDTHLVESFSHEFHHSNLSKSVADPPARQYFRVLYSSVRQITQPETPNKQLTVSSFTRFLVRLYQEFFIPCSVLPTGRTLIKACLEDATAIAITGATGLRTMNVLDDFKDHHPSRYSFKLPVGESTFVEAMMLLTAILVERCRDPVAVTDFANYISTNILPTVSREDITCELFPSVVRKNRLKHCETAIRRSTIKVSGRATKPHHRVVLEPDKGEVRAVAEHTIVLENKRKVSPYLLPDWTFLSIDMRPDAEMLDSVMNKEAADKGNRQQPQPRSRKFKQLVLPTAREVNLSSPSPMPLSGFNFFKKLSPMISRVAAVAGLAICAGEATLISAYQQRVAGWLFSDWPDPTTNPLSAAICRNVSISDLSAIRFTFRDQSCAAITCAALVVVLVVPQPSPPPLVFRRPPPRMCYSIPKPQHR